MLYQPEDYSGNKFLGQWSEVLTMQNKMFYEDKAKYHNKFMAQLKAKRELESVPICFDKCITDVSGGHGLTGNEKNCLRECYFKRVSVGDDMHIYFKQRFASGNLRAAKDRLI
jgi:hypothetical protein